MISQNPAKRIKGDAMVLRQFFGLLEGQSPGKFLEEVKKLSPEEIMSLADGIREETFVYD